MYRVDEIEDAILGTLQADSELSSYVKIFVAIPTLDEKTLESTIANYPAIGVLSSRSTYDYATSGIQTETAVVSILCFNRNLRSPTAATRGERGLWAMVDDCNRVVRSGGIVGVNVLDWIARRRELIYSGERFSCAALEVEVKWR